MVLILAFLVLVFSVIISGYLKTVLGYFLGDKNLNLEFKPLKYIDFFGTILIPVIVFFISKGIIFFGYPKKYNINYYHFKKPKRDIFFVNLISVLVYLFFAVIFVFISKIRFIPKDLSIVLIAVNLSLFLFNLLPLYPFSCFEIVNLFVLSKVVFLKDKLTSFLFFLILLYFNFFSFYSRFLINISTFLVG